MNWNLESYKLKNGLDIVLVPDEFSALACVNITYKVGSKNEDPEATGMAHLLEHLMFSGTKEVPNMDEVIQNAGGTNNAFTSTDITNYYAVLPKENMEVALFLEADRMANLILSEHNIEKEKSVVIEEYKERYENAPYGDVIALLRDMVYTKHPYRWSPIGLDMEKLRAFTIEQIQSFYEDYYHPSNAVLCVSGNFDLAKTKQLIENHFGRIQSKSIAKDTYATEPNQSARRSVSVEKSVPVDAYFLAFRIPEMYHKDYYTADLLCDLLGKPGTGLIYQKLVFELGLCAEVGAMTFQEKDPGMMLIACTAAENGKLNEIKQVVRGVLDTLQKDILPEDLVQSGVVRLKTRLELAGIGTQDRALMAGMLHTDNRLGMLNKYLSIYSQIDAKRIQDFAKQYLISNNENELNYISKIEQE